MHTSYTISFSKGAAGFAAARYAPPPILKRPVPQTGQTPLSAGRPFFMVIVTTSFMGCLALHFTQYASGAPAGLGVAGASLVFVMAVLLVLRARDGLARG